MTKKELQEWRNSQDGMVSNRPSPVLMLPRISHERANIARQDASREDMLQPHQEDCKTMVSIGGDSELPPIPTGFAESTKECINARRYHPGTGFRFGIDVHGLRDKAAGLTPNYKNIKEGLHSPSYVSPEAETYVPGPSLVPLTKDPLHKSTSESINCHESVHHPDTHPRTYRRSATSSCPFHGARPSSTLLHIHDG